MLALTGRLVTDECSEYGERCVVPGECIARERLAFDGSTTSSSHGRTSSTKIVKAFGSKLGRTTSR